MMNDNNKMTTTLYGEEAIVELIKRTKNITVDIVAEDDGTGLSGCAAKIFCGRPDETDVENYNYFSIWGKGFEFVIYGEDIDCITFYDNDSRNIALIIFNIEHPRLEISRHSILIDEKSEGHTRKDLNI